MSAGAVGVCASIGCPNFLQLITRDEDELSCCSRDTSCRPLRFLIPLLLREARYVHKLRLTISKTGRRNKCDTCCLPLAHRILCPVSPSVARRHSHILSSSSRCSFRCQEEADACFKEMLERRGMRLKGFTSRKLRQPHAPPRDTGTERTWERVGQHHRRRRSRCRAESSALLACACSTKSCACTVPETFFDSVTQKSCKIKMDESVMHFTFHTRDLDQCFVKGSIRSLNLPASFSLSPCLSLARSALSCHIRGMAASVSPAKKPVLLPFTFLLIVLSYATINHSPAAVTGRTLGERTIAAAIDFAYHTHRERERELFRRLTLMPRRRLPAICSGDVSCCCDNAIRTCLWFTLDRCLSALPFASVHSHGDAQKGQRAEIHRQRVCVSESGPRSHARAPVCRGHR